MTNMSRDEERRVHALYAALQYRDYTSIEQFVRHAQQLERYIVTGEGPRS